MTGVDPVVPEAGDSSATASRARSRRRVWSLNVAVAGTAAILYFAMGAGHLSRPSSGVPAIPLLGLTFAFALTEIFVVHLKFRHDAHTFSLSEIPFVLGLFCAAPTTLLVAQLLGGGAVLAIHRRQSPIKLAFNLATYAISVMMAEFVFHAVIGHGQSLGPRAWLAGVMAATAATWVAVPAIYLAVTLSDGRPASKEFLRPFGFSMFGAWVTSSIGLIAVELLEAHPLGELLLVVPTVGLYMAHRAYVGEREKHHSLKFLYDSTRLLHQSAEIDSAVEAMLAKARDALRADIAVLTYHPADGDQLLQSRVGPGLTHEGMRQIDGDALANVRSLFDQTSGSLLFNVAPANEMVHHLAGDVDINNGIVVALQGETRIIGALLVANRLSEVSGFQPADVRLLETLASHLCVALENGRLEQSLAQLRVLERQLTHQAHHDPLTGLANRTLFSQRLTAALTGPDRGLAVLFIDLDDFKTVNDSLGHSAGDALLIAVAERLGGCLRDGDIASRLGGDEFAVLLDGIEGIETAVVVADRILQSLDRPVSVGGQNLTVAASIGLAIGGADTGADAATLMRNADTAMYGAKAHGKGCWVLFSPEMHEAALVRQDLMRDLVGALDNEEFVVYFQPLVDMHTGVVVAAEALVRWVHPTRGLLGPDSFIPLAEETGRISRLTEVVLLRACELASGWPTEPGSESAPAVSVNLSARDFDNPGLTQLVLSAIEKTGLAPERLIVEITETLMLSDTSRSITTLRELAATGVRIALDDFGTGYSSLNYLGQLPLHWIKIAKTFVDELGSDSAHDALAQGIVELGHILQLSIIAEGIERPDQLATLQRFGCDIGQGFLFGYPMDPGHFLEWLRNHHATSGNAPLPAPEPIVLTAGAAPLG
jgi:diguanylate cyclase (GGDEF)-like protein